MESFFIKIGNSYIDILKSNNDFFSIKIKDFLNENEILKNHFNKEKKAKIFICSTNLKIEKKVVGLLNFHKIIVNNFLQKNNINYSNIAFNELGFDIYYALEYLSLQTKSFLYISFGTFYSYSLVKQNKLEGINISNSIFKELNLMKLESNIPINYNLIIKSQAKNNWGTNTNEAIYNGIIKIKQKIIDDAFITNPHSFFVSGKESKLFILSSTAKEIINIELIAMQYFHTNNNLK